MLPYLAAGGHGYLSGGVNIAPALCSELHTAWAKGNDKNRALALHKQLMPLHDALSCEASPGPVKYAAERLGFGNNTDASS